MKKIVNFMLLFLLFTATLFAVDKQKVLSEEEAFKVNVTKSADVIAFKIELADGIYLYDEHLKLSLITPLSQSLDDDVKRPKPVEYEEFIVHFDDVTLLVPTSVIKKYVKEGDYTLQLAYQGCSKIGICYPPLKKEVTYNLGGNSVQTQANTEKLSEQDAIAKSLQNGNILIILLSFFGFGILLSLTPCIFPMIPILSSIIVSQGENMTTKKSFILSLVYVLAMALAYTIAGVLAGLFGANLQAAFQNPWVISTFSFLFVALSFSMFGFYNLQLPSFLQSKLTKKSDQMQGQGVIGVAVMGFLSALIVGPCVAAPLAGALIYIGQSGDALLGGLALFVMSLGMGLPLILIGMSAGKFMPRPGEWMDNIKSIFGVILLGVAIWMISRIVPALVTMLLLSMLIIGSAIYMGALEQLEKPTKGWKKLIKSIAIIFFIYGVILFIGAMSGNTNPLAPLKGVMTTNSINSTTQEQTFEGVHFNKVESLQELQEEIQKSTKPIMIDFYADWCVNCIELEQFTFSDAKVEKRLQDFTLIKVDVTKNSDEDKKLLKYYGLFGPPALIFYKDAQELKNLRIVGFKNARNFLKHIEEI